MVHVREFDLPTEPGGRRAGELLPRSIRGTLVYWCLFVISLSSASHAHAAGSRRVASDDCSCLTHADVAIGSRREGPDAQQALQGDVSVRAEDERRRGELLA